ncbi:hypothetical protein G7Y89_g4322 [Cudoniella acicularis]|uniref:DUF2421 domain-containing protein n=1 Tax=Cudoniella acicularis TaxID=354080 RepID=A0A8H4RRU3_9HELO|nr:hypothetical protein G7Y89_g4322 [Cudoniella acicularis]
MIAIGMKGASGSTVFNLACNVGFSVIRMASAFANWYMVDGKTPGVIAMFAVFMATWFYFAARYPRFLTGVVAGALTHVLVIGYALQVRVIGIKIATATGQPYYPTYELAPYRLLIVVAGSFIVYIWTIFPVPITEGSVLRRNMGASFFLLASYLSSVTTTVDHRIQNKEGDMTIKSSPGRQLKKLRSKLLDQQIPLLNSMRQNLVDMSWEPTFGGDFPKDTYTAFIKEIQDQYLTVISYSSSAFSNAHSSSSTWLTSFAASRVTPDNKSHKMTSLLALLSASIRNNQALPP